MSKIKVHAWDILRMIPDEEFAKIAKDTKVDYCAKVLDAKAKFVGRIKTNRKMQVIENLMTENTNTDLGKLELVDDLVVFLYMSIKESEKDCEKVKSQKGQK